MGLRAIVPVALAGSALSARLPACGRWGGWIFRIISALDWTADFVSQVGRRATLSRAISPVNPFIVSAPDILPVLTFVAKTRDGAPLINSGRFLLDGEGEGSEKNLPHIVHPIKFGLRVVYFDEPVRLPNGLCQRGFAGGHNLNPLRTKCIANTIKATSLAISSMVTPI